MKRVLALAVAAAMVLGAVVVRGQLDDDGGTGDDGDGRSGERDGGDGDGRLVLLCDPAVAEACERMEAEHDVRVEVVDSATVADDLGRVDPRDAEADGWLVPDPFPAMVEENRDRAGLAPVFDDDPAVLASRSPVEIVMWTERLAALRRYCDEETDTGFGWRCIGDNAGRSWSDLGGEAAWGRLEPGFEPPATSAIGLLVVAEASTAFFETADFASNDFATEGFTGWLRNLEDSVPQFPGTSGTPLDQMLALGPSSYDFVATLESRSGPAVERSRDRDRLTTTTLGPMTVTADLVLATTRDSGDAAELRELVSGGDVAGWLAESGWRVEGEPLAPGVDPDFPLPPENNLPRPGVLQALRDLS